MSRKDRINTRCDYCLNEIEVINHKFKKNKYNYCNQECRTEHLKAINIGENNPNFKKVDYDCDGCGKSIKTLPYKHKNQKHIFCSNSCYINNIGSYYLGECNSSYNKKELTCDECGHTFLRSPSQIRGKKVYCSAKCQQAEFIRSSKLEKVKKIKINCSYCLKELNVLPSKIKLKKHIYCSIECKNKGWSKYYSGSNSPQWNHDIPKEKRIKNRKFTEYYDWRLRVYEKDNFTCQCCGSSSGGNLVAHHVMNYAEYPELRTNIKNGLTLCAVCHKEFHDTYGYTKNNYEQLSEFLQKNS